MAKPRSEIETSVVSYRFPKPVKEAADYLADTDDRDTKSFFIQLVKAELKRRNIKIEDIPLLRDASGALTRRRKKKDN